MIGSEAFGSNFYELVYVVGNQNRFRYLVGTTPIRTHVAVEVSDSI